LEFGVEFGGFRSHFRSWGFGSIQEPHRIKRSKVRCGLTRILLLLQDVLDGIEFARGPADSEWGKLRAEMGHPEPFDLKYMAIGNEDCGKQHYEGEGAGFHVAWVLGISM
jgi:alpha-L-arabinofuranosidase